MRASFIYNHSQECLIISKFTKPDGMPKYIGMKDFEMNKHACKLTEEKNRKVGNLIIAKSHVLGDK